jgi:hypothetical protein
MALEDVLEMVTFWLQDLAVVHRVLPAEMLQFHMRVEALFRLSKRDPYCNL